MTIALGILAKDAIVLAADTQETFSGVFKLGQGKILCASNAKATFAVTGAGSSAHLDSLNQQLCGAFARNKPADVGAFHPVMASIVADFNAQHIAPFAQWPEYDRPACSLVIGLAIRGHFGLWTTEKSAIREAHYGAVGIGAAHATLLLSRLMKYRESQWSNIVLAAYVMWFVKQSVEGCGKDTQIIVLEKKGTAYIVEVPRIEKLEALFHSYAEREDCALQYIFGMGKANAKGGLSELNLDRRHYRDVFASIHHQAVPVSDAISKRSQVPVWLDQYHPLKSPTRSRRRLRRRTKK